MIRELTLSRFFTVVFAFMLLVTTSASAMGDATPKDTLTLTNRSGNIQSQYPFQFGRPFLDGEIPHFPQVMVNGNPLPTQADVKSRYPDGSVKQAVISVIIPEIPVSGDVTLSFRDQPTGNNAPLSVEQMLSSAFDFDATIDASNQIFAPGKSVHISARKMLESAASCADDVTISPTSLCAYWIKGDIATTIILADHSVKRAYDFGFTGDSRPVRPIFQVTFWPSIHRVKVRFIAEIADTQAMQDEFYSFRLGLGSNNPRTVYSRDDFAHHFATRWTDVFWIGGEPEQHIDLDENMAYLSATGLVANYDSTVPVDQLLNRMWSNWQTKDTDIGDRGFWDIAMGDTGGRWDIGNIPTWTVLWLYTGDWRAREIALKQADLAANWPLQVREGQSGRAIDRRQAVAALGRTVTAYDRPTLWLFDNRGQPDAHDAIRRTTPAGFVLIDTATQKPPLYFDRRHKEYADASKFGWKDPRYARYSKQYFDGWMEEGSHQPDAFYVQYLLTGDYWYLEELQMWAGASSLRYCAGLAPWCRGPGAGIQDEVRGDAWVLRHRANAAVASPDSDPDKKVFADMVDDALALWEGQRDIRDSRLAGSSSWQFGHGIGSQPAKTQSPLHFWENNIMLRQTLVTSPDKGVIAVGGGTSPWMQNYLIIELGRAKELGFPSGPLLDWVGQNLIGQLTSPQFNPYLSQAYRMPVTTLDHQYMTTWADVKMGYPVGSPAEHYTQEGRVLMPDITYISIARAAASFLTDLPNGAKAWRTINSIFEPRLSDIDPSWGLVPRSTEPAPQ